jgi:uncharacterized protein (TIGR02001 family)
MREERFNLATDEWDEEFGARLEKKPGGSELVRLLASASLWLGTLLFQTPYGMAADLWGGSFGLTNDYIVRGISRTDHQAAVQFDLHYLNTSGIVAGVFVSNAQLDSGESRDAELNAFLGFQWTASDNVRGKIMGSHYAYPWNHAGSRYNYDELNLDVAYQEWVDVSLVYSPNAPRYFRDRGIEALSAESVEITVQRPLVGRVSATAGAGYYFMNGPRSLGYGYWSAGAAYNLAPVSLVLSYVGTTAEAKTLFYTAAVRGHVAATLIWRF